MARFLSALLLAATLTFFLGVRPSAAFELNMNREEVAQELGKTFVKDLVIGDKAYMNAYFLCWDGSQLSISSDATIEPLRDVSWYQVGYTFLVEPAVGGMINLKTIENKVKPSEPGSTATILDEKQSKDWADNLAFSLVNRSNCDDMLDRNPSLEFKRVGTINNIADFKTWFLGTRIEIKEASE